MVRATERELPLSAMSELGQCELASSTGELSLTPPKGRKAKRPSTYGIYETNFEGTTSSNQRRSSISWDESSVAQLLSAVKERTSGSIDQREWEKIGAQLSPPRSASACKNKMALIKKQQAPSEGEDGKKEQGESSPKEPLPYRISPLLYPEIITSTNSDLNATPPELPIARPPVSVAEQPFSAKDDLALLRLNAEHPGGLFKTISHLMHPKRHKQEVRDCLEQL